MVYAAVCFMVPRLFDTRRKRRWSEFPRTLIRRPNGRRKALETRVNWSSFSQEIKSNVTLVKRFILLTIVELMWNCHRFIMYKYIVYLWNYRVFMFMLKIRSLLSPLGLQPKYIIFFSGLVEPGTELPPPIRRHRAFSVSTWKPRRIH